MSTDAIRDTIELAKLHEQQNGHLASLVNHYIQENTHYSIHLPKDDASASLLEFVDCYIDYVPDFIDKVRSLALEASIERHSEPFLKLAEDYFLKPPEIMSKQYGLIELMDEAYLAHRLMEEVNDRFMARTSIPLLPFDTTMANILVHSLIGEPFANELDEAVQFTTETATIKEDVYDKPGFQTYLNQNMEQNSQTWPCLMDQMAIDLQFVAL